MYLLTSGFLFTTEVTFHECGPMTLLWAVPASTDGIRPDPPQTLTFELPLQAWFQGETPVTLLQIE